MPQQPLGRTVRSRPSRRKTRCQSASDPTALRPLGAVREEKEAVPAGEARQLRQPVELTGEPLLHELDLRHSVGTQAPGTPSGRSASSTDRGRRVPRPRQRARAASRRSRSAARSNAPRNPCTCSGLPFGRYGASHGRKPSAARRSSRSSTSCGLVIAGEGVLHDDDAARALAPTSVLARACGVAVRMPRAASSRSMLTPDSAAGRRARAASQEPAPAGLPTAQIVEARHPRHQGRSARSRRPLVLRTGAGSGRSRARRTSPGRRAR